MNIPETYRDRLIAAIAQCAGFFSETLVRNRRSAREIVAAKSPERAKCSCVTRRANLLISSRAEEEQAAETIFRSVYTRAITGAFTYYTGIYRCTTIYALV